MENPEKIYLASFDEKPDVLDRTWYWEKQYNCYNTEYIRTDAFIEKASEYLEPILTEYAGFYVGGDILQHFKNYMRGE